MKKITIYILAYIGAAVVLTVLVATVAVLLRTTPAVPDATILEVDFERRVVEAIGNHPLTRLSEGEVLVVREIVEALERASDDAKVIGLIARVGKTSMGWAQIQEVRDAVMAFRKGGKLAVAYAETFGEVGPGNRTYYLATAFEKIYLQPSGDLGLTGLIAEQPFLKGTFEKLGIEPRLDHRHEYKNAMNQLTERAFTRPHHEATEKIVSSLCGQMIRGIAASRKLSEREVRVRMEEGPFFGQEAVETKLLDGLAYRDEVYEQMKAETSRDANMLSLGSYLKRTGGPHDRGEAIALIYGTGPVMRGKNSSDSNMGSDTVTEAFRTAVEDEEVRAILFRVDSPGGSYVASDAIWRATTRARAAGKPVIVSMGNVAGSGGYFVAMSADKIVAQPGTLTGSIGVVGGKMLTKHFWEKLGLTWDTVQTSANSQIWSSLHDYSETGWGRLQTWLDRVYADFTRKVAEGRDLPLSTVREVAKGRVWTGEDAKALGLVDALGGLDVALDLAREAIGLSADAPVHLRVIPEEKSTLELILAQVLNGAVAGGLLSPLTDLLETLRPVTDLVDQLHPASEPDALMMNGQTRIR